MLNYMRLREDRCHSFILKMEKERGMILDGFSVRDKSNLSPAA